MSDARQQFKMAATFSNERNDGNFKLKQRRKTSDSDTGRTWSRRREGEEGDGGGGGIPEVGERRRKSVKKTIFPISFRFKLPLRP